MDTTEKKAAGGGDASALRKSARDTVTQCKGRWDKFRKDAGQALDDHMARSFTYVTNVLDDESKPKDWIKDGFALWIRCYGTGRDLCKATHELYCPPDPTE